ncbi:CatA-like O-acetyltransferase [Methanosarcina sp. 1.H.A.2.2]|uniref:CatA-like O-acetyltransferase n=1 Tax=Methanosarcina sp. 1.H.A.2.2 TaxID=1483601 RepID=UPI000621BF16|nr:CatA-like O-acetyltransferase [Methanosarcina sp. 1.H.A.2.2]KKH45575.1 hypothetical protein EO93_04955 [Methanosarcina sp. 1.H.A.2.2]
MIQSFIHPVTAFFTLYLFQYIRRTITFTHISHTDFGNREKAQPIFEWGKYREREGKLMMPFAVQVHHAFVDGIHIGKLADKLQRYLDEV